MNAFLHGELMLNLNVPPNWNGSYQTTRLGMRWYRDAVQFVDGNDGSVESTFTIGAAYIDNHVVEKGMSIVSKLALQVFPHFQLGHKHIRLHWMMLCSRMRSIMTKTVIQLGSKVELNTFVKKEVANGDSMMALQPCCSERTRNSLIGFER